MSKDNEQNGSACPVASKEQSNGSSNTTSWASWLGFGSSSKRDSATAAPTPNTATANNQLPSGCPVSSSSDNAATSGNSKTPASLEEAAAYAQTPHPDQKGVPLSTHRVISSIPRGATDSEDEKGPHHQPPLPSSENACNHAADSNPTRWMYPSEQQFFNALRKKGWDNVEAESIPSVLQIHNTVNERTWNQIVEWEQHMDLDLNNTRDVDTDLKLVRFMGRPNDISPQAFLWTKIFRWADPPFDRHDWYVQKQSRTTSTSTAYPVQRYVIDYYMFPPLDPQMPPTPYVDARPALDSPRAFYLRAMRLLKEELPGITSELQSWRARRKQYYDGSVPAESNS